ncbi:MAG: hypothetical protein KDA99_07670, partial [Planctomycetales bacterium]|nr:hypothetical protein [Planctomycetales bacterium]
MNRTPTALMIAAMLLALSAAPHIAVAQTDPFNNQAVGSDKDHMRQDHDQLPPAPSGKSWQLVWRDEFNGTRLDDAKWDIPDMRRRDGWWTPKAVSLDGQGHLSIDTMKDGDRYLDACVRTRERFEHAFGYYVAR